MPFRAQSDGKVFGGGRDLQGVALLPVALSVQEVSGDLREPRVGKRRKKTRATIELRSLVTQARSSARTAAAREHCARVTL